MASRQSWIVCASVFALTPLIASCGSGNNNPPVGPPTGNPPSPSQDCGSVPAAPKVSYDGVFVAVGNMNVARSGTGLVALGNGGALVAGDSRTVEVYDPASQSFSVVGQVRGDSAGANGLKSGCVLLIESSSTAPSGFIAEIFHPATGVFSSTGGPLFDQISPIVSLPNGVLLWCGGFSRLASTDPAGFRTSACQQYDPATGMFKVAGSLLSSVDGLAAAVLSTGRVLYTGGTVFTEFLPLSMTVNTAQIYDPATQTSSAISSMNVARAGHTATTLEDGRVLIAGGNDGTNLLSSVEVFDPNTNTFAGIGNMSIPRWGHGAILLADGRVLIWGGRTPERRGSHSSRYG